MRFCKYCGTPVALEETQSAKKERSKTPLIVVLCMLIVAAIAMAVLVYNDNYKVVLSNIGFWQESEPVAAADRTEPIDINGQEQGVTETEAGGKTGVETTRRISGVSGCESDEAAIAAFIEAYEQRDSERLASICVFSLLNHSWYDVDSGDIRQAYHESFGDATGEFGMDFTTTFTVNSVREITDYEDRSYTQMFADIGVTKVMQASVSQAFHGSEDAEFPDRTIEKTLVAVEVNNRWYITDSYFFRLLG